MVSGLTIVSLYNQWVIGLINNSLGFYRSYGFPRLRDALVSPGVVLAKEMGMGMYGDESNVVTCQSE